MHCCECNGRAAFGMVNAEACAFSGEKPWTVRKHVFRWLPSLSLSLSSTNPLARACSDAPYEVFLKRSFRCFVGGTQFRQ
jgi:hypothetical protein